METQTPTKEVFGHEVTRDQNGEIVDQNGVPLSQARMPHETQRADACLTNENPDAGIAHQYGSEEEAREAQKSSREAARQHVAENLPAYVAMAMQDAESTHGGNTSATKINIDRK